MDPVRVWGWATIRVAAIEIQYPPDPATSDMETTTGFSRRASSTSRQMTSDPTDDPPGLSTRRTMALIEASSRAVRIQRAMVLPPMTWGRLSPVMIIPEA